MELMVVFVDNCIRNRDTAVTGGSRTATRSQTRSTRVWTHQHPGSGETEPSVAFRLTDLAQGITNGETESAGHIGVQVRDQSSPGVPHLFHRQHHAGLAVVVVVTDGDGPRDGREIVLEAWRNIVGRSGMVVDRAPQLKT